MDKRFKRSKENFVCENCQKEIIGNGYTNHCPLCLYSKHVDVNPGDRKCSCNGLMEPIAIEKNRKGYVVIHKCIKCGTVKRNKSAPDDSFDAILAIAKQRGGGK